MVASAPSVLLYVGSYLAFHVHRVPAGNQAYWVYLRGGDEIERGERALHYFYYPVYKVRRMFGAGKHDCDRELDLNYLQPPKSEIHPHREFVVSGGHT